MASDVRARLRRAVDRVLGPSGHHLPPARRLDEREDLAAYDIGRHSWGHLTVTSRGPGTSLTIGAFCSFAYGAHVILGGEHRADYLSTYRFSSYPPFDTASRASADDTSVTKGAVVIGNDVWLGHQCLVLSGVTIGDGAIIGAGSVVRHDVPPYGIVAGNPARVAGFRFAPEQIEALLALRWWDWPLERITAHVDALMSDDVTGFLAESGMGDNVVQIPQSGDSRLH